MTRLGPFGSDVLGPDAEWGGINIPKPINKDWHCRNQLPVATNVTQRAINAAQHVYAYRRKQVFSRSVRINSINGAFGAVAAAGGAPVGTETWYEVHVHTGHGCAELVFFHLLAPPLLNAAAANPRIRWNLYDTSEVLLDSTEWFYTPRNEFKGGLSMDDIFEASFRLAVSGNTTYLLRFEVADAARIVSSCVYEHRGPILVPGDPGVPGDTTVYKGPICADDYYDLVAHMERLRSKNGTYLFNHTQETNDASAQGFSSTTWTNIVDASTGFGNAAAFKFDLAAADFISGRGIGCRLAVRGSLSAAGASTSGVRLIDSLGNSVAVTGSTELTGWATTSKEWRTLDFKLGELAGPIEVQARGNGTQTFNLNSVMVYLYEAGDAYPNISPGAFELLCDYTVTGSAVSSFDFPCTLDGDTDNEYMVRYRIIQGNNNTGSEYVWRINGTTQQTVTADTHGIRWIPNISYQALGGEYSLLANNATIDETSGWAHLRAKRTPGSVAFFRAFVNQGAAHSPPMTVNDDARMDGTFGILEDSQNITQLGLAVTLANTFDVGSYFQLWRLRP